MAIHQLVYASHPFGFDEAMLNGILAGARRFNADHDITGSLICRQDLFLQLLEGPEQVIIPLYSRISADDRHLEVVKLLERSVDNRLFPHWAMRSDPAQSWLWDSDAVKNGAIRSASPDELVAVFERSAATQQS